jgi:16S rRNA (adenine1518-N6/adenine1519-N6)-dimethyltransferase
MVAYAPQLTKTGHPKKSLGQHFLTDPHLCRRITRFADIKPDDTVIEIGPGTGNLTAILLKSSTKVIGIEYDPEMIRCLSARFSPEIGPDKQLELVHADILKIDWDRFDRFQPAPKHPQTSSVKLVGNLPYNIATRILSKMTETKFRFQTAVVMVQREVAHRMAAEPGTKDYGYFTLLMQFHFVVQLGFEILPGAFAPRPKVVSQVVKLTPQKPRLESSEYEQFLRLISRAFFQRRKTLWNNLKSIVENKGTLEEGFRSCGVERSARPEQVSLGQYLCMTRVLSFPS